MPQTGTKAKYIFPIINHNIIDSIKADFWRKIKPLWYFLTFIVLCSTGFALISIWELGTIFY